MVRGAAKPTPEKGEERAHSGRLLLRMPRSLHGELARLAEKRGVSLNQLIVGLLSNSISDGGQAPHVDLPAAGTPDLQAQRRLSLALTVNLVVLVVAGAIAIALLIVALNSGI